MTQPTKTVPWYGWSENNRKLLEVAGAGVCYCCKRTWTLDKIRWNPEPHDPVGYPEEDVGYCPYCDMPYLLPLVTDAVVNYISNQEFPPITEDDIRRMEQERGEWSCFQN